MKTTTVGHRNLFSGLMFIAIALFFGLQSFPMGIGTPSNMGPGFFPLMLSALLAVIGIATVFSSEDREGKVAPFRLRGLVTILAAPLLFAALVTGAGFIPALWLAVFLATFASKELKRITAAVIATAFTAAAWLVFIVALGMPVRLLGRWFGE